MIALLLPLLFLMLDETYLPSLLAISDKYFYKDTQFTCKSIQLMNL